MSWCWSYWPFLPTKWTTHKILWKHEIWWLQPIDNTKFLGNMVLFLKPFCFWKIELCVCPKHAICALHCINRDSSMQDLNKITFLRDCRTAGLAVSTKHYPKVMTKRNSFTCMSDSRWMHNGFSGFFRVWCNKIWDKCFLGNMHAASKSCAFSLFFLIFLYPKKNIFDISSWSRYPHCRLIVNLS